MVAFHFPPMRGSSGIQRSLKFAQYLPDSGWTPLVLSANRRAYASSGDDQLQDILPSMLIWRTFALDTSRHLAIKGRYPGLLALPDRWASWALSAVPVGWRALRRYRPEVIWSTYPIATAHLIGLALHRLTGTPWVADMRDPMSDDYFPTDPFTHRVYRWIETKVIRHCSAVVCTTPGAVAAYRLRFPDLPATHFTLIENGFDEENFSGAAPADGAGKTPPAVFTLVHSGLVYPLERDPLALFDALAALQAQGRLTAHNFRLVLRGSGHDDYLRTLIEQRAIASLVVLAPQLPYREALHEMLAADGLLILQGASCNHQVPAKVYEYLRARRPILALTDPAGDTAALLAHAGIDTIVPLEQKDAIIQGLSRFLDLAASDAAPIASAATIAANSRRARTRQLAALLDNLAQRHTAANQ
ncbi:MAG TPA: glycosyltransferase [Telluria sp.]|nr:glycosyltransferase [Telluria sp.]